MKLTLNQIMGYNPCGQDTNGESGISKLMTYLNKKSYDGDEFSLITVLKSNSINDALWCLRCFDYLDICLFMADLAESVLPIFEAKNESKAPRRVIQAVRDYKAGKITVSKLKMFRRDAYTAAYAADNYAYAYTDAAAAYTAAYAADNYAYADADAAAAYTAAYAAYAAYTTADARKNKWLEIEELFIKHFGE